MGLVGEAGMWMNPELKKWLARRSSVGIVKRSGRRQRHWGAWGKRKLDQGSGDKAEDEEPELSDRSDEGVRD